MRIKSKFKDYYDYVAHRHGGGDPRLVYLRGPIVPDPRIHDGKTEYDHEGNPVLNIRMDASMDLINIQDGTRCHALTRTYDIRYLVVAGRWYLLVRMPDQMKHTVLDQHRHPEIWDTLFSDEMKSMRGRLTPDHYLGQEAASLVLLSRILNAPVFVVSRIDHGGRDAHILSIMKNVPILADTGLSALVSPEQMYQKLAYFFGNKMHTSPDMIPPVQVSDKDRLVQHGFDLKRSFRPTMR